MLIPSTKLSKEIKYLADKIRDSSFCRQKCENIGPYKTSNQKTNTHLGVISSMFEDLTHREWFPRMIRQTYQMQTCSINMVIKIHVFTNIHKNNKKFREFPWDCELNKCAFLTANSEIWARTAYAVIGAHCSLLPFRPLIRKCLTSEQAFPDSNSCC